METEQKGILPKDNAYLAGHEKEEKSLFEAWKNNSLHNSWIISGVEGIGKATLAYKFARFLLSGNPKADNLDVSPSNHVFHLVSNNAHPDLKVIERDYTDTEKRKIIKAIKSGEQLSDEELGELKKSAFIRVDDVRNINEFLTKKSSLDGWRAVIVDSVDELNNAGANAILKVLEEPPYKTIMLLISHNPNKLLPTILSRCAKLNLKPLDDNIVASLLRRYRSELSEKNIKSLVEISAGSIGKAIKYADTNAVGLYDELSKIIYGKNNFSTAALIDFAGKSAKDEDSYFIAKEMILKFVSNNMKNTENVKELAEAWDYAIKVFDEVDRINLDKKQILVNILVNIINAI
ncbi:MAG: DNA polymerase III subunit delta' [Lactobacillaceae bacterium]|jgi:DNA polymerase-3 subunit delta'|nr:DNA polymerase III subunit delta' [Lactobacillaceae bacterium]